MVTHYFTLHALAGELDIQLCGGVLQEIFTQQRNELLLTVHRYSTECCLTISVEPALNYVYVRDTVSRAKKNTVDIFHGAAGRTITAVVLQPNERILQIRLDNETMLQTQLFNTSESNILLTTAHGELLEAFKHDKDLKGQDISLGKREFDGRILTEELFFERFLQQNPAESIFARMKAAIPILGSTLAREVLHRSRMAEGQKAGQLEKHQVEELFQSVRRIFDELENPQATIYYRGDVPKVLSVIPLQHLAGSRIESFENVNQAVRSFIAQTFRHHKLDTDKNRVLKRIKKTLEDSRRNADAIEHQITEARRGDEYERMGNLIMANLQNLKKGTKEVEVPDFLDQGRSVRLSLDPKLSPGQNATRYFEKARKARIAHAETRIRLTETMKKISSLETLLLHLDNCQTVEQIKEFSKGHQQELKALGIRTQESNEKTLPFRVFTVSGGFEVWVGKSAANNDLLTTRYANSNDLWFHARGASGSHTVLKLKSKTPPPAEAIRQAAGIAAYYSKMRKASAVPIAYCERKYVHKPRNSPEGTVVLEREKVIFVEPGLP